MRVVVSLRSMWACLAVWVALDLVMIGWGHALPEWARFDGEDALRRDIWVAVFVFWMWVCFSYRAIIPQQREGVAE